jgi:hypothetical protein
MWKIFVLVSIFVVHVELSESKGDKKFNLYCDTLWIKSENPVDVISSIHLFESIMSLIKHT